MDIDYGVFRVRWLCIVTEVSAHDYRGESAVFKNKFALNVIYCIPLEYEENDSR